MDTKSVRKQIGLVGLDACTLEELYIKYGEQGLVEREDIFRFYFAAKQKPNHSAAVFHSQSKCSDNAFWESVAKVRQFFGKAMDEIKWSRRLDPFNHSPHFPHFATHFTDAMPIACVGGALSDALFNPKKGRYIWKVTVAIDFMGNILWISTLQPGSSPDVIIWDNEGPSRTRGDFFDFEVGLHDGAYKGRIHVVIPFVGRGSLTARQESYNSVHGWYRARVEHVFAHLWHWGIIRHIWNGSPDTLHQTVRILLHTTQFCLNRKLQYPPYGPWEHIPKGIWPDQPLATPESEVDGPDVAAACQLCYNRSTVQCEHCNLSFCQPCNTFHSC